MSSYEQIIIVTIYLYIIVSILVTEIGITPSLIFGISAEIAVSAMLKNAHLDHFLCQRKAKYSTNKEENVFTISHYLAMFM